MESFFVFSDFILHVRLGTLLSENFFPAGVRLTLSS